MFLLVSFLTRSYKDSCSCDAVCYTSNDLEIVSQFSAQVARPRVSRIFARTTTFALTQASIYFSFAGHVVDHGSPIEGFAPWQVRYHRALLLHQAVPAVREGPRLSHFKLSGPFFCLKVLQMASFSLWAEWGPFCGFWDSGTRTSLRITKLAGLCEIRSIIGVEPLTWAIDVSN